MSEKGQKKFFILCFYQSYVCTIMQQNLIEYVRTTSKKPNLYNVTNIKIYSIPMYSTKLVYATSSKIRYILH